MIQILMATYNGEKYIAQQLDSLLTQTYTDFEILVRDDCSTDSTFQILTAYAEKNPGKIHIFQNEEPTGNAKNNFFRLMQDASADFVLFCDQDDYWLPDKIEKTYQKMQTLDQSKPALVHTNLSVADQNLKILHKSFFKMQHFDCVDNIPLNRAIAQNTVTGCTVMINKPLLAFAKNTNHPDIIMHDWWLAILAAAFGSIAVVKRPTMLYRQHGKNAVGAKKYFSWNLTQHRKSLKNTYNQANHFLQSFSKDLLPNSAEMLNAYITIKSQPKFQRIKILMHYKCFKQSLPRKIAQILLI